MLKEFPHGLNSTKLKYRLRTDYMDHIKYVIHVFISLKDHSWTFVTSNKSWFLHIPARGVTVCLAAVFGQHSRMEPVLPPGVIHMTEQELEHGEPPTSHPP